MAVFHFRLKDSATGETRTVAVAADSKEEAEATILRQESKKVNYTLDPKEAADFEKRLKDGTLTGRDKARLFSHQQEKPYKIQKGEES